MRSFRCRSSRWDQPRRKLRLGDIPCSSDRPQEKGGEDRGAMGGEHILMGLGGCLSSNLLAAIRAREAAIDHVTITVSRHGGRESPALQQGPHDRLGRLR